MIARGLLGAEDDEVEWKPKPENWTLQHEMLAQIRDRLGEVATLLTDLPTATGKRNKPPAAFPRPETALSRARAYLKAERERAYDDRILDFAEKAKERWRRMSDEEREALTVPREDDV